VDAVGYLDAIEKAPSDQVVVVCIYDPEVSITLGGGGEVLLWYTCLTIKHLLTIFQSTTSSLVEDCLNTIASRHPAIHFIKLHHEIAEMDHIKPPAILAYRDADVFATFVDIPQQIPKGRSCSADSLEDLLKM
jgi:hypothetical protein